MLFYIILSYLAVVRSCVSFKSVACLRAAAVK